LGFYIKYFNCKKLFDEGGDSVPDWLSRQFTQAFYFKDKYRIKLLNDFWFSYLEKELQENQQSL